MTASPAAPEFGAAYAGLRERLIARADELRTALREAEAEQAEAPSRSPHNQVEDIGEQGEQRIREAVAVAESERDVDELNRIAQALERFAAGDYGSCLDCGSDIPMARLDAQPAALRCVECQARFERRQPVSVRIPPIP